MNPEKVAPDGRTLERCLHDIRGPDGDIKIWEAEAAEKVLGSAGSDTRASPDKNSAVGSILPIPQPEVIIPQKGCQLCLECHEQFYQTRVTHRFCCDYHRVKYWRRVHPRRAA